MNLMHHVVISASIWTILIFVSLPLFIQQEEDPKLGHDHGAPKVHHLKAKLFITLLLAIIADLLYFRHY
ncbi:MAG: DUF1467 family protein [Rickettsiaceae bacterium]|nr:DUF1467 family protein [Rickettsiaceae bacterium]